MLTVTSRSSGQDLGPQDLILLSFQFGQMLSLRTQKMQSIVSGTLLLLVDPVKQIMEAVTRPQSQGSLCLAGEAGPGVLQTRSGLVQDEPYKDSLLCVCLLFLNLDTPWIQHRGKKTSSFKKFYICVCTLYPPLSV
jgi:hypothetical protein